MWTIRGVRTHLRDPLESLNQFGFTARVNNIQCQTQTFGPR